ncbi:MAG: hypothetical protein HY689_02955 [Chloroflexi bacterium]|nr:hypothetical protein [Chloroflexota bacterium]
MALVLASDISAFVNTIFEDALLVARDNNLMAALVTGFNDRAGTAIRQNSTYGTAVINSIAETDDMTSQAFTPSSLATLTPAEFGAQFFVTDLRQETDLFGVRADAAMELGLALAQSVETNLLNDFSSLTGGTVGAAGTAITWGHFFAMVAHLRGQNAPRPWFFVCSPNTWHVLGKAVGPGATVTNSPQFQDEVLRNWYVGSVAGVDIFTSSNTAAGTAAYAALFSRPALALDIRRAPRLEPERDASRRGIELNMTMVYAHGVWRPKFGVQGIFDASLPTS